jgi:hypothetical protein
MDKNKFLQNEIKNIRIYSYNSFLIMPLAEVNLASRYLFNVFLSPFDALRGLKVSVFCDIVGSFSYDFILKCCFCFTLKDAINV